jgi:hypothetical protein
VSPERRTLRRHLVASWGVCWGVTAALLACQRESPARTDSSVSASSPAATPGPSAASPRGDSVPAAATAPASGAQTTAACASEGEWQSCSVEKRLTDAGFVPINKGPAPSGVFPVAGTSYALGAAQLHVYIFKSAKEREQAVAGIDTTTVSRRGAAAPWSLPPTFITSNNLVAIFVSDNARQIERVQLAITAGLPRASH